MPRIEQNTHIYKRMRTTARQHTLSRWADQHREREKPEGPQSKRKKREKMLKKPLAVEESHNGSDRTHTRTHT